MGVHIPQGEGAIFGRCPDHSKTLAIFAAKGIIQSPITSCSRRDHMPGKRKQYSANFWMQAMRPIGRERGGGISQ